MVPPHRSVLISVERELPGGDPEHPTRVRLSMTLEPREGEAEVPPEAIDTAVAQLRKDLDQSLGASSVAPHRDRPLSELVQTYRPRQAELVELLHEEGELSDSEHALLRRYVEEARGASPPVDSSGPSVAPTVTAPGPPPDHRPLAAAPLAAEHVPSTPRPVAELLARFQIGSLKQAGAVRARRQISFEEYMALKRHFEHRSETDRAVPAGQ